MSDIVTGVPVFDEEDTMSGKYLVFYLDNQQFAVTISSVVDIINVQPITRVPNCPPFIIGITNLRGKVIPIMDIRMRLGKERQEYSDRTCIIVVEERGMPVGFIVDNVAEVIDLTEENISPPPTFGNTVDSHFIEGVGKSANGVTLLLNCRSVLDDGTLAELMDSNNEESE